jgi:formate-dependent nitrite reductase membrane component NrfD
MNEIDVARHSHMIDPQLHVWGWEIPVYLFLGGMAAGAMILTSLLMMRSRIDGRSPAARWLAFAAPVLVSVGMGALFLDLSYKVHVWRFYLAFRWTSPMSWGAWILIVVYPVSLALAVAGLGDEQGERVEAFLARFGLGAPVRALRSFASRRLPVLSWANLVLGIGLGIYTGVLLSTLGARALWASALLGPLFLASGVSAGAAFLLLFRLSDEERHFVVRWDKLAIGLEVAVLLLFLAGLATSGAAGKEAVGMLLGGPFTASFWSLVVLAGLAVPFLLETLESRLHLRATAVAPLLVLAGGFALRWIMVAAGQA